MRKSHSQSDADREKCSHLSYISSRAKGLPTLGMGTGTRHTIVVPPCQNVSHTVSRAETHRIELSVTGCVHQSTGGGREPLATSRLRHSGVVQRNRARTRARHDHTHTHYMESTTETLSVPYLWEDDPTLPSPKSFARPPLRIRTHPQRIVCGYPCLVGLLLASYRLRQQRRYQCAYELTNKEQVITNSSPTIPA
jgi:hypothetical protein